MSLRTFVVPLKWLVTLLALAALLAAAGLVNREFSKNRGGEAGEESGEPEHVDKGVIKLSTESALSHGLKDEPVREVSWLERVTVYGRVVPNPRATVEIRAPFAGLLRAAPDKPWPALGSAVAAGQVVAWLDIRVGPLERLELQAKLAEARLKQKGAEKILKTREERAASVKGSPVFSGKEQDEVRVQLAEAKTALDTAKAAVKLWEEALADIDRQSEAKSSTWSYRLTAPIEGEVTELAGRAGMFIEAGGLIARLVDFRRALVRLDIPQEALSAGSPPAVAVFAAATVPPGLRGAANRTEGSNSVSSTRAFLVGTAPGVDATSQLLGYWYEVRTETDYDGAPNTGNSSTWRPGLFVKAHLKIPQAKPRTAFSVPTTALLYHQGRALVYVRLASSGSERTVRYKRREVQVLGRDGERWVLAEGVTEGDGVTKDDAVVSHSAQVLLSEEFKQGGADND